MAAAALLPATAQAVEPGMVIGLRLAGTSVPEVSTTTDSGARWVRLFVDWSLIEPADNQYASNHLDEFTRRVDAYQRGGVKVLMVVLGTPGWARAADDERLLPPDDPNKYGEFIRFMADHFKGSVGAYEVWNEPDGEEKTFWRTGPDPAGYTRLVQATWRALNGVDPRPKVITAGTVGNNYQWYEQLYAAGLRGHFDALGVHTDTACNDDDPTDALRDPNAGHRIHRYSFTGYREVYEVMKRNGDADKKIWMTELGWSTSPHNCNVGSAEQQRQPGGVSQDKQRDFLRKAYYCLQADPYVEVGLWFSLQDVDNGSNYDHHLGLFDSAGREKLAWAAYKELWATGDRNIPSNPNCGPQVDTTKPTVQMSLPTAEQEYTTVLPVRARATDDQGVLRMELWADGRRVEGANQTGSSYSIDWNGSRNLSIGKHTIEVRAYDAANNYGSQSVTVNHVSEATASRSLSAVWAPQVRRRGRTVTIVGRLAAPAGSRAFKPKGRMRIFFEYKKGKRWVPFSRYTKGVSKTIRITHRIRRPGTWRMYMRYAAQPPYKVFRTKPVVWRIR